MGGEADNFVRPEKLPCGSERHIVLADMDTIGIDSKGDIDAVVHDKYGAAIADRLYFQGLLYHGEGA